MKHIDLFSGIGGFALAVDTLWPGSEHVFCDYDPFCQQILKKHWPNSKIYADIHTFANPEGQRAQGGNLKQQIQNTEFGEIDILTGGFPCQPFSAAGKRLGTEDNRYLWPEMFRIIRTFKPTWIVAENVRGLATWNDGLVLEQVCTDMEREGYEVQPFIIPAVAINAPHRRDRIWFIAYTGHRNGQGAKEHGKSEGQIFSPQNATQLKRPIGDEGKRIITYPDCNEYNSRPGEIREAQSVPDFSGEAIQPGEFVGTAGRWEEDWQDVATRLCGVDDGLPVGLDRFKLTKAAHRIERLKSLGNSIVPQVAIEIMRAIYETTI